MQFKQTLVRLFLLIFPITAYTQTTWFPQGARENVLIERLEVKATTDSVLNFTTSKPYSTKQFIPVIQKYYDAGRLFKSTGAVTVAANAQQQTINEVAPHMTSVDLYNAQLALMNYPEWSDSLHQFKSKKPILKAFYKTPANFFEVNVKDFFLVVNPVIQYVQGKEMNNSQNIFLNTRGVAIRGRLANKIGFYTYLTDNQERDPLYVQQWITAHKAVPGEGFYKDFKAPGGVDYFDARGYISFNAAKYIDITFGYDKNVLGEGYRSLFLSDFSSPYLFLRLNTRIWKLHYEN